MNVCRRWIGPRLVAGALGVFGQSALADVISVPSEQPTIQAGIDAAQNGDTVLLEDGVYSGPGNRDLRFNGKAIAVVSANGPENCVIDAGGTSEEPYRGFIFDGGETTEAVLDGLTIRGGATLPGAIDDQFNGGGLFFREGSATIRNCVIGGNACGCWGAGVYCSFGAAPVFINCDISGNRADDDGGAVFAWNGGSVTLINCTLNENQAAVTGGAIASFGGGGGVTVVNATMAGNEAPFGSAVIGWNVVIDNSVIWGNTGEEPVYQNAAVINYSIVQGGYAGVGNVDADPVFVDEAGSDYRLRPGSPAIDAADNGAIPAGVDVDLDGNPRFHDDPGTVDTGVPDGPRSVADMGSFEFQGSTPRPATLTNLIMATGTVLQGGLPELVDSDDLIVRTRSGFGDTLVDLHHMELIVEAETQNTAPSSLDCTIESRIDYASGVAHVSLLNWSTYEFDFLGQYPIGLTESVFTFDDIEASNYVSGNGQVYIAVKHLVFVPFLAFTFESMVDQIEIVVE